MNDLVNDTKKGNDNPVTILSIVEGDNVKLFNEKTEYVIPLYQRAYTWEVDELRQFIDDINGVADGAKYIIGSLVVSKRPDMGDEHTRYEVVDGQQRLTSLFLLLNCLDNKMESFTFKFNEEKPPLSFECRKKSNYTLRNIKTLLDDSNNSSQPDMESIEPNIRNGIKILSQRLNEIDKIEEFKKKLSKVILYRIELPEHTDLNRYFEIMNTRGEQLEQHDILKARLMSYINDEPKTSNDGKKLDMEIFAQIWEACSNMTGYVQMRFTHKLREAIFGDKWENMPSNDWKNYTAKKNLIGGAMETTGSTISSILEKNLKKQIPKKDSSSDSDFKSIIDFPHFLLHTLKVYIELKKADPKIVNEELDDKKLEETFKSAVPRLCGDDKKKKADFARDFIMCLLRTRYLFDQYIIKREYKINSNDDGKWSLESLKASGTGSDKSEYHKHSVFGKRNNDKVHKTNLMIQSALRVSYTSPESMHWITELLKWLSDSKNLANLSSFHKVAENIAIDAVTKNFFEKCEDGVYAMGVKTPNIVFNYLDYLLWCNDLDDKGNNKTFGKFEFKFRDSVEHWYPQHPTKGTVEPWNNVDRFGNLCLLPTSENSHFSNLPPASKKTYHKDIMNTVSIKHRIMIALTKVPDDKGENKVKEGGKVKEYDDPSYYWKEVTCVEHEEEMIRLLKDACGIK